MKKDYDRTICEECSLRDTCIEYRNKFWCKDCAQTLLCFMKRKNYRDRCAHKKQGWIQLPPNCLLFGILLERLAQGIDDFIKSQSWICPRCLHETLLLFENATPQWHYNGWCFVCGVGARIS